LDATRYPNLSNATQNSKPRLVDARKPTDLTPLCLRQYISSLIFERRSIGGFGLRILLISIKEALWLVLVRT
jgi:hypothetical protein